MIYEQWPLRSEYVEKMQFLGESSICCWQGLGSCNLPLTYYHSIKMGRQQLSEYMVVQGNNTKSIKLYQSYDKMDLIGLLCCGIYKGRTRQYFMILTCWQKWVFITVKITPILLLYMETYLVWSGPRGRYLQTSVSRSNFTAHEDRFRLPCDQQAIRYLIGLRPQNEEIVTLLNFHN